MKIIIAIVTIFLIAGAFIFGWIFLRSQKQKKIKLEELFKKTTREYNLLMHYKDVFNKKLIGLDKKNKKLLLLNLNTKGELKACVHIDEINSCTIVHLKDEYSKSSKSVFLELARRDDNEPIRFYFYDELYNDVDEKADLILKARHWKQRINYHKNYA